MEKMTTLSAPKTRPWKVKLKSEKINKLLKNIQNNNSTELKELM